MQKVEKKAAEGAEKGEGDKTKKSKEEENLHQKKNNN